MFIWLSSVWTFHDEKDISKCKTLLLCSYVPGKESCLKGRYQCSHVEDHKYIFLDNQLILWGHSRVSIKQ